MKEMWEICYQAMVHEHKKMPTAASLEDIDDALQEVVNDLECAWLTAEKVQRMLPNLRRIANKHGCLERIEQIQALLPAQQTHSECVEERKAA